MKLQEIFSQLQSNEFSLLSIGGQAQGVINEANQETVVNSLNLGLTNLHTRFNLKEGELKLVLVPGVYLYNLKSAFQIDNLKSKENVRYIDSVFKDDLAKVEQVRVDSGKDLGLNDKSLFACSTPSTHTLRVPKEIVDRSPDVPEDLRTLQLELVYRALHPAITTDMLDMQEPEDIEVDLPYPYLEPLLYFMASRVHHPKGMAGDFQMGASYAAKYEQACQRLENVNLQTDRGQANTRLERGGWV